MSDAIELVMFAGGSETSLCAHIVCQSRVINRNGAGCVPGDIVGLAPVPDGAGMRVEHGRRVDYALLKLSHWYGGGKLEEDAEQCDEDEEALCEDKVARTHSCRRCGFVKVVSGGREERIERNLTMLCWDMAGLAEGAYI